ncbi:MAG TPA: ribosomal protein S18-alanine N-acetyltransferase [Burkholderiaceae bacterium]|nr:ribosomal protein S18-alanine N-acetyltransferase [Burkholderiaceae bacterium]
MSAVARPHGEAFEPMTVALVDAVHAVERSIYPFPWTRGNFLDALQAGNVAWILRGDAGDLVGYCVILMAVDEAHLLNLSVAQPWQRRGYGWKVLEWAARCAREYGARTMLLEVRPSNAAALSLYRRYGFQHIGVRRGYYPAPNEREDALVMRLTL